MLTLIVLLQVDVPATWLPNLETKLDYNTQNFYNVTLSFKNEKPIYTRIGYNLYCSKRHISPYILPFGWGGGGGGGGGCSGGIWLALKSSFCLHFYKSLVNSDDKDQLA